MEREDLRQKLTDALLKVAPEWKGRLIRGDIPLQEQLDLDSVDLLNYVIQVQKDFQLEVPNQDFQRFMKLDDAVAYLMDKVERSTVTIKGSDARASLMN